MKYFVIAYVLAVCGIAINLIWYEIDIWIMHRKHRRQIQAMQDIIRKPAKLGKKFDRPIFSISEETQPTEVNNNNAK